MYCVLGWVNDNVNFTKFEGVRIGEADNPGPGKKEKQRLAAIACLNTSGKVQLRQACNDYMDDKVWEVDGVVRRYRVVALTVQEHHTRGDTYIDLVAQVKRSGWDMSGSEAAPANRAQGKAGVGVLARRPTGIGVPSAMQKDLSPSGAEGRLTAAWIDGILHGGILVLSIYLFESEGLSDRNVNLIEKAGQAVVTHGGPWVIGGDFNLTPAELSGVNHLIRRMRGTVVAPNTPTGRPSCTGRVIDFFLADERILGAVQCVFTDVDSTSSPHLSVILALKSSAARQQFRTVRKLRTFPDSLPIGCLRPEIQSPQVETAVETRLSCSPYHDVSTDKSGGNCDPLHRQPARILQELGHKSPQVETAGRHESQVETAKRPRGVEGCSMDIDLARVTQRYQSIIAKAEVQWCRAL